MGLAETNTTRRSIRVILQKGRDRDISYLSSAAVIPDSLTKFGTCHSYQSIHLQSQSKSAVRMHVTSREQLICCAGISPIRVISGRYMSG